MGRADVSKITGDDRTKPGSTFSRLERAGRKWKRVAKIQHDAAIDYKKPEFYLKNLPLNDSLLAISNEKIAVAYFNAGRAFSEKIADS